MDWNEVKKSGSEHYKTGSVEPIDLYKAGGFLQGYIVASIIKYAYRNRACYTDKTAHDMEKIKHLADIMISVVEEEHRDKYSHNEENICKQQNEKRECETCKYEKDSPSASPCRHCYSHNEWTPKGCI
jgi:hypothetical protein